MALHGKHRDKSLARPLAGRKPKKVRPRKRGKLRRIRSTVPPLGGRKAR